MDTIHKYTFFRHGKNFSYKIEIKNKTWFTLLPCGSTMRQELITRSLELSHIPVTAFSQTDLTIFSLKLYLCWIQIPTGTPVTNCNQKHALMLTCRHVHVRPHCFILTEACSCRLELEYFAEKYLKIDWSVKMPLHWLIMGVAGS